jgi:hypothetical protein
MSIRQDEVDLIRQKVLDLTVKEQSFTAFDVTRELHKAVDRPHRMIKAIVHGMFAKGDMGDYVRDQISIPSAPNAAWLYHLPENDPQDYLAKFSGVGTKNAKQASQAFAAALTIASSDPLRVSCDNRIYLPTSVAKYWGLKPGDMAACLNTGNKIIVKKKFHNAAEAIKAVNAPVDAKGNIRINGEVTTQFSEKAFKYSSTGDEIVLEPEP